MIYLKIVNPNTGRKVNIKSHLGRKIIANYIKQLKGGNKWVKTQPINNQSDCTNLWYTNTYFIELKKSRKKYTQDDKCSFFSHCSKNEGCGEGCENNNCTWIENPYKNSCIDGLCINT